MSVYPEGAQVRRGAHVSADGVYRYRLTRDWSADSMHRAAPLPFIMMNPSTADGYDDDPTIRKCVGIARRLGYGAIAVSNLYAYRATKPLDLWAAKRAGVDVVGPETDMRLRNMLAWAHLARLPVVAAWGSGVPDARVREVLVMDKALDVLRSLALTAGGVPRHPLMLAYDAVDLQPLVRLDT